MSYFRFSASCQLIRTTVGLIDPRYAPDSSGLPLRTMYTKCRPSGRNCG